MENQNPAPVRTAADFMKAIGVTSLQATFNGSTPGIHVEQNPDGTVTKTDIPKKRRRGIR